VEDHLGIRLLKEFDGQKITITIDDEEVPNYFDCESAEQKKALISAGIGEDIPAGEYKKRKGETNDLNDVVDRLLESIDKSVGERFDAALEANNAKMANRMGERIAAVPVDERKQKMGGFDSKGDWLKAIVHASRPGGSVDPKLVEVKVPQGLNTLDGTEGGFAVIDIVNDEIIEFVFSDPTSLMSLTDQEVISGNSLTLKTLNETSRATGSRRGGVEGFWTDEADQITKSKPAFSNIRFDPKKLAVLIFATDEQLSDSINLATKLGQYASEEIVFLMNDAIINGEGTNKPLGIRKSPSLVTVAKEGGQAADTINFQNIIKMFARMLPGSIGRAIWLANIDTVPQLLALAFPDASGTTPVWLNGNQGFADIAAGPHGAILGRTVMFSEHAQTLGDEGDFMFLDLGMYKSVTRGTMKSAISMHLRFDFDEMAFRWTFRADGKPMLKSAITPKNGTNTLSPFITLAERA